MRIRLEHVDHVEANTSPLGGASHGEVVPLSISRGVQIRRAPAVSVFELRRFLGRLPLP